MAAALATTVSALLIAAPAANAAAARATAPAPQGQKADGRQSAPRRIDAQPRPGAATVPLTRTQRKQLLDRADEGSVGTARELKLGAPEKLVSKDVVKDADGTVHTRYERTYAGLPVIGGDVVVHAGPDGQTVTGSTPGRMSLATTKAKVSSAAARKTALDAAREENAAGKGTPTGRPSSPRCSSPAAPATRPPT